MSDNKGYNGWTNYETWNVKLWIDNDESLSEFWREQTREAFAHPARNQFIESYRDRAAIALADMLKDDFETQAADLLDSAKASGSMWADMLNASLSEVDWREIAEAMLDDEELTDDVAESQDLRRTESR